MISTTTLFEDDGRSFDFPPIRNDCSSVAREGENEGVRCRLAVAAAGFFGLRGFVAGEPYGGGGCARCLGCDK